MPNLLQAQSRTATVSRPGDGMLVAIDARVEACQMLADSALPGAKVIIIHPDKNGVEQITAALVSSQASSLHVVCHGEPGCLHLGKTPLHGENLQQYRQQLQRWRVRDILLVACYVAGEPELQASSEAKSFLRQLRQIAGANIAASARRVGNPARGGSWELEYRLGDVSSPLAFLPEIYQTYPGIFPPSFSTATNFTVAGNPKSVIVGDLNGDGKLDLIAPDTANNSVKVMLGNGTGFAAPSNFAVGNAPESASVGDFNGDGLLDLVAANATDGTVTVLLGNGTGTSFSAPSNFAVGNNPQSVSVGDFNRDGLLDLVAANATDGTVTVLLANTTGTAFPTSNTFAVGNSPQSVSVADFNQDGKLDLVTTNATDDTVTVLLGNGTGTAFPTSATFAVGNNPQSASVADFNGDGKLDLAAANYDDGTVTVLLANSTGTAFSPSVTFTAAAGTNAVAVGDFNQDGKLDLAATNFLAGTITVGFGDGTGTAFPSSASFATGSAPWYSAVGDFNGDGKVDLAATTGLGRVAVLSNLTPTVSLAAGSAPSETGPANGTYTITLDKAAPAGGLTVNYTLEGTATLTADYAIDQALSANVTALTGTSFTIAAGQTTATLVLVPVDDGVIETGGETVTLKLNPGIEYILAPNNGAPIEVSSGGNFPTGMGPNFIAATDFNGDGKLDFATTNINENTVTVRLGDGTGTGFATASTWGTGTFPTSIAVGDFNGDGKLDFAVTNYGFFPSDPDTVTVRLGDGTGTGFTSVATLTVAPDPGGLSFGDFNGDGKLDFIVGSSNQGSGNTVAVWLGDGTGTGFTSVATLTAGTKPQSSVVGDFNGDGKLDFAVAGLSGGNITVWLGDGTGTGFTTSSTLAVGNNPVGLSAGDFNGDGKLDLAVANSLDDTVTVLLGNGTGTGFSSTTIAVGGYPGATAVGDFNGDGKLDLAVSNQSDSTVTVLFADGTGTGFSSTTFTASSGVLAVADFNGDGKVDFATPDFGSGNVSILLNQPQPQATLTIADNDVASVLVTPAGTTVAEGGATLTYTVVLTSQPTADVTIAISSEPQTTTDVTTLTFNSTNWNVAQTVTVTAVDDGVIEDPDTSTISHAPTSADPNYNGIAVNPVTAEVADNDKAGVLITPTSPAAAEGGATASYTVVLTSQPDADVTIAISSNAQTTTDAATLTFTIDNWDVAQTVTVTAVDDSIAEGNHTGNITHTATSIDTIYNIPVAGFAADIADNDTAGVLIAATSPTATEGGATLTYTVVLTSQPTADVTIVISPNAQVTTDAATLTFTAANWNVAQTVTVTAVDDTIAEGNHTGNIAHAATSLDANYNIAVDSVTANITDNDSPGISINPTATGAAEGGATGSYSIVLTTAPTADVTINFNVGSQIGAIAPITFTPSNWNVVQTVTVTAVDDTIVEGTHAGTISHAATSADVNYNELASASVSVEIADNDKANNPPVLQNAIADISSTASTPFNFTFPANTFTDPDGDALTYTATLEDGSPLPAWLTFDATTGTFSGTPTPNNLGSVNVKVTASDGSLEAIDVFTITVSEEPNNPPVVVTPIADNRVEVSANFSYAIAADAFSDPDGDVLTFTATLEDGSPLPAWLTFDANTRTFSGTPTANNLGNINVKVTVSDGSLTASDIFALTVFETPTPTPAPTPNPLPTPTFSPAPTAVDTSCLCDVFPTPDVGTPTLTPNQIAETLQGTEGNELAFGDATAEAFNVKGGSDIVSGLRGGDNIYGGAGGDLLFGNEGNDYIDGGTGSDIIFAGKDNDAVTGGADSDTVVGDIADDALLGGDGADMLFGNTGSDTIDGEAGDDIIFGGKDNDALKGNLGNDVILGDVGNDTILGNEGNDFLYGNTGADFVAGGTGEDTLFGGKEDDIVKGGAGNDIASGDIGSDSVCGGEGNDVLFGNVGADSMDGCEGDDALYGGKDSDTLIGNQGNDILFGEMGSDSLIGGTGSDTFVLTRNGGSDIVYDFEDGSDKLALSGGLTIEQLSVTSNGTGTNIAIASTGELLATLNTVPSSLITAEDFVLI